MKLWIDECLSPALVDLAQSNGYMATCTRDRGQLGLPDDKLLARAVVDGFAFVTNDHADFWALCAKTELHAGLVTLPQGSREDHLRWLSEAIAHIEGRARESGEACADWMLNRVVEVHDDLAMCTDSVLPGR